MPVARPLPHISPAGTVAESSGDDPSAEWIDFNLSGAFVSCSLEPKVKPSNTGKQGQEPHGKSLAECPDDDLRASPPCQTRGRGCRLQAHEVWRRLSYWLQRYYRGAKPLPPAPCP